jgi:predicted MFS family arabinose efflux permease
VAILGSILNNAYQSSLGPHLPVLPTAWRTVSLGSIAGASNVGNGIGGPIGGALIRAANEAYTHGMAEVMLVSAGLVLATAIAIAIFLPSRVAPIEPGDA